MSDQGAGNIPVTGDEHVLLQNDEGAWIGEASTQQIADLGPGGSGSLDDAVILAPDSPTRNQITPDGDFTALEIVAEAAQTETPFIITSDTPPGTTDLLRVRQSVALGDNDIFTVDDSGEVDITLVDGSATALNVQEAQDGDSRLVNMSGSMANRVGGELIRIAVSDLDGGDGSQTVFDGGLRIFLNSFGEVVRVDPVAGTTTLLAHTGQTAPLLDLQDEDANDVLTVGPHGETVIEGTDDVAELTLKGSAGQTEAAFLVTDDAAEERVEAYADGSINQYLADPAVIGWLIKAAPGQTASVFVIDDEFNNRIFDFDIPNGSIIIRPKTEGGVLSSAVTTWYAQSFAGYGESDMVMSAGGIIAFELDTYSDVNTPANSYTHLDMKTQPGQAAGNAVVRLYNEDLDAHVHRILPSGAIGTSSGEPADADINPGECFRYFIPTNGAAKTGFKGKTLDGTVVKREDAIP